MLFEYMRDPSLFNASDNIHQQDMNRCCLATTSHIDGTFGAFGQYLAAVFYKLSTPVDNLIGQLSDTILNRVHISAQCAGCADMTRSAASLTS